MVDMTDKEVPWERGVRKGGMMNRQQMIANLLDFKEAMDKHSVRFVLIFGSLLGAIREKGLIHYDTDADVMCFASDHLKMLGVVEELRAKGFTVPDRNECPLHDHFFIRNGEKVEIWWFVNTGTEYIYDENVRYPKHYFDKLDTVELFGTKWNVPSNPEEFLARTYGIQWQAPNPNGHHLMQPK